LNLTALVSATHFYPSLIFVIKATKIRLHPKGVPTNVRMGWKKVRVTVSNPKTNYNKAFTVVGTGCLFTKLLKYVLVKFLRKARRKFC
jgi:hypothetical protein